MGNNIFALPLTVGFLMMVTGGDTKSPIFIGLEIALLSFLVFVLIGNVIVALLNRKNN